MIFIKNDKNTDKPKKCRKFIDSYQTHLNHNLEKRGITEINAGVLMGLRVALGVASGLVGSWLASCVRRWPRGLPVASWGHRQAFQLTFFICQSVKINYIEG